MFCLRYMATNKCSEVRNTVLSLLLQGTIHNREGILEQEMGVPKGLSMETAISVLYVTYLEHSVCKCLNNGHYFWKL